LGKQLKSIIFLARLYQLSTQISTFALISGQPAWFDSGDYDNKRNLLLVSPGVRELVLKKV